MHKSPPCLLLCSLGFSGPLRCCRPEFFSLVCTLSGFFAGAKGTENASESAGCISITGTSVKSQHSDCAPWKCN